MKRNCSIIRKLIPIFPATAAVTASMFFVGGLDVAASDTRESLAGSRPNIILIMADDLGYSDLGSYGGEVSSPELDRLANEGMRFRRFYNYARCCPTRASLLTGLSAHAAGLGHMTSEDVRQRFDYGTPSYQGWLTRESVTLGEALGKAGYRTLMTGKWHVGTFEGMWPRDRGFDRFYGIVRGAANFYEPSPESLLTLDDTPVPPIATRDVHYGYHKTDAFTDYAIEFIEESVSEHPEKPFFLYLAHTAPHWPLHAPEEYVEPYRQVYAQGWEEIRRQRFERQIEMGIVPPDTVLPPIPDGIPAWDSLDPPTREEQIHRMSLHAGMITQMDKNIGLLRQRLEELGVWDDTIVLFLSDNGVAAEGGILGSRNAHLLGTREGYFLTLGESWANASNTPMRLFKHWTTSGGAATPFIIHWPNGLKKRGWSDAVGYVGDFMPTFLDLAGGTYPETYNDHVIKPLPPDSISFVPTLEGRELRQREIYLEHEGNRLVIWGPWKAILTWPGEWELYYMENDRTEMNDLAEKYPVLLRKMGEAYDSWAEEVGVMEWPAERIPGYEPPFRAYPKMWTELTDEN